MVGLGLASAIGAAIARPDRLPVAALGDGGALMGVSELETAVRLGLPLLIVVYDDEAYGAEVHHFGPDGYPLDTVRFPAADIAAVGRGFGCAAVTVRGPGDLAPVRDWLAGPRDRPLVLDAKVTASQGLVVAGRGVPRPLAQGLAPVQVQQAMNKSRAGSEAPARTHGWRPCWTTTKTRDAAETRDARFEFGLECLLDGIAARRPATPAPQPPPPPAPAPLAGSRTS